ncbi:DUF2218 domain-containing protein [Rhizobium sp. RAF56]|jgi:hypothetical protein|uniref:DUF2218 domain-containing protein n=1 Tax=Rhizobium sp. RAF56 TaxID=3233062 RepID=UPI003F96E029
MPTSVSIVQTSNASRYLQQLCKHWSHKFEVEFNERHGRVPFGPQANVAFDASDDALTMTLGVADEETRTRMQTVVADHLKRFAFREDLVVLWADAPDAA